MRSVKIMLMGDGYPQLTHPQARRGYAGRNPIVEIVDVPDGETGGNVLAAYARCIVRPLMHADIAITWRLIADATQGRIVHLTRGRPEKPSEQKLSQRVSIKLDVETAQRWARTTPADIRSILRDHLPPAG